MITTQVRVVSSHGGRVLVESTEQSGCGGCSSRSACGVSGLAKYFSGGRKPIALSCDAIVHPGDELSLQMSESDLLKAGLLAYLLPCVFAILGAGVATVSGYGDVAAVSGALCGIVLGLLLMHLFRWSPDLSARPNHSFNEGETP